MKKKILMSFTAFLFLAGIGVLLYPTVSSWLAKQNQSKAVLAYNRNIDELDADFISDELEKARIYNDALLQTTTTTLSMDEGELSDIYTSVLNINGTIGYIEIPIIDVSLSIYHDTSDEVLQKGVGHMKGSAFPIGGEGNHSVLTGHSGLSTAKFFDDLEQMEKGDVFYIHILNETLAYEVDQILVVKPDETEALQPVKGKDYVTLVTCTPFAVNTHRLLVRGTRIPFEQKDEDDMKNSGDNKINWRMVMIITSVTLSITFLGVYKYKKFKANKA